MKFKTFCFNSRSAHKTVPRPFFEHSLVDNAIVNHLRLSTSLCRSESPRNVQSDTRSQCAKYKYVDVPYRSKRLAIDNIQLGQKIWTKALTGSCNREYGLGAKGVRLVRLPK